MTVNFTHDTHTHIPRSIDKLDWWLVNKIYFAQNIVVSLIFSISLSHFSIIPLFLIFNAHHSSHVSVWSKYREQWEDEVSSNGLITPTSTPDAGSLGHQGDIIYTNLRGWRGNCTLFGAKLYVVLHFLIRSQSWAAVFICVSLSPHFQDYSSP